MKIAQPLAALALVLASTSVTACNTMKGVGEDVRATGETITEAADEAEDDLTDGE